MKTFEIKSEGFTDRVEAWKWGKANYKTFHILMDRGQGLFFIIAETPDRYPEART